MFYLYGELWRLNCKCVVQYKYIYIQNDFSRSINQIKAPDVSFSDFYSYLCEETNFFYS